MTIVLNGEPHPWPAPRSVEALLADLQIDTRTVAVERNRVVVKRARYAQTVIEAGDEIEIVSFVGGG
ncbi:MAG: sulfur carrier protein ThiS [Acidimicrobiia bacterium]|nr:sulfur carrier protein ThiS [Acidimicrobiia bacterium]